MSAAARSQHPASLERALPCKGRPSSGGGQGGSACLLRIWRRPQTPGLGAASVRERLARAPRELTSIGRCCTTRQTGARRWAAEKVLRMVQSTVLRSTRQIKHCLSSSSATRVVRAHLGARNKGRLLSDSQSSPPRLIRKLVRVF